jgi:hypothetical protein
MQCYRGKILAFYNFFLTGKTGSFCVVQKNNFHGGDMIGVSEKTADDNKND